MKIINKLLFKYRFKKAVKKATDGAKKTGRKYYVILFKGKPIAITKQRITYMVRTRKFKKGIRVNDIERQALFVTSPTKG